MIQWKRDTFSGLWIITTMLFMGLVPQLSADDHTQTNESGWVQTNGPYGGEILALHAASKDVLLVGTEGAGIFRSTDHGNTWAPVNTGLPFEPGEGFTGVTAFAQKGDMLYAGTRDALYASTDGGNTWHQVPIFGKGFVSVSDIMFIGARVYVGTLNSGVWYSDDGGESWQPVMVTIGDRMYTGSFTLNGWVLYSDDGDSWWRVPPHNRLGAMWVLELASIGTTLVAATQNKVFRQRTDEDALTAINDDFVEQRINAFAAMDDLFYAGGDMGEEGNGVFRSDDEGNSWTHIATEEMTHTVEAMAVYGATLYAGTSGDGVFRSDDKGDSWTTVNDGLTHRNVSTLLAVDEDTVFAGTSGGGVFRTTDGGNSWMEINTGLTNTTIGELEVVGNRLYTNVGGKIVYTIDPGESWQPVKIPSTAIRYGFPTLSASDGELYVGAVRYAPRDPGGETGIFRVDVENNTLIELVVDRNWFGIECMEAVGTTFYMGTLDDGVIQWKKGADPSITNLGLEHHYIAMLAGNGESICAGTGDEEIYRFRGEQWEPIHPTGMTNSGMSDLKWVGSTLYATFWNGGVFRSVNSGESWTPINDGLDEPSAASMGTDGAELYIGTFTGVFRWIETKKQWEPIGSLPHQILSLAVLDGSLYAGTAYSGVFKIRIAE
ncbi:MAG: hypothetical protein OYL97_17995 [Candidatus Poribacteria bacterium]|nr:hypothetical protein [Candidatus Poribacteria bacterium]